MYLGHGWPHGSIMRSNVEIEFGFNFELLRLLSCAQMFGSVHYHGLALVCHSASFSYLCLCDLRAPITPALVFLQLDKHILGSRLCTALLLPAWCALSPISLDLLHHIVQCCDQTLLLREATQATTPCH